MITIYHNPRCTKSREGLCEIENLNQPLKLENILMNLLQKKELKSNQKLNIKPLELVRTKESIWMKTIKERFNR